MADNETIINLLKSANNQLAAQNNEPGGADRPTAGLPSSALEPMLKKGLGALGGIMNVPKDMLEASARDVSVLGDHNYDKETVGPATEMAMNLAGGGMPMAEKGAAGIFGGRLAQTADLKALQEAERMRMHGMHPNDVWNDTGWYRSPMDSKWRFEIPDNKMALSRMSNGEGDSLRGQVRGMVSHPELIKAYPEIGSQGMWVTRDSSRPTGSGMYNPIHDDLKGFLKPYSEVSAPNMQVGRSVGAHELQHAVQDIEGFAFGANPDAYARFIEQEGKAAGRPFNYDDVSKQAYDNYHRTAGEVEARNVQKRLDYGPIERRAVPPWTTQDVPYTNQVLIEALKGK